MPKRTPKPAAPPDPDKLVRQSAGTYRTSDERFEVRDGGTGWFLVDTEQTNDFGQELLQGPFAKLAAVRAAIPPARSANVTPIRPPARPTDDGAAGGRSSGRRTKRPAKPEPPPPPPSWIDRLPKGEAAEVRRLIGGLERDGIGDAEALVRRDREGIVPALATRLIERRLAEIVEELPERGRAGAWELIRRAVEVLTAEGRAEDGRPGWMLVETGREAEPDNRRITIRELPD
jgi:hypothetical protein